MRDNALREAKRLARQYYFTVTRTPEGDYRVAPRPSTVGSVLGLDDPVFVATLTEARDVITGRCSG